MTDKEIEKQMKDQKELIRNEIFQMINAVKLLAHNKQIKLQITFVNLIDKLHSRDQDEKGSNAFKRYNYCELVIYEEQEDYKYNQNLLVVMSKAKTIIIELESERRYKMNSPNLFDAFRAGFIE